MSSSNWLNGALVRFLRSMLPREACWVRTGDAGAPRSADFNIWIPQQLVPTTIRTAPAMYGTCHKFSNPKSLTGSVNEAETPGDTKIGSAIAVRPSKSMEKWMFASSVWNRTQINTNPTIILPAGVADKTYPR